jgi:hypothetical protein
LFGGPASSQPPQPALFGTQLASSQPSQPTTPQIPQFGGQPATQMPQLGSQTSQIPQFRGQPTTQIPQLGGQAPQVPQFGGQPAIQFPQLGGQTPQIPQFGGQTAPQVPQFGGQTAPQFGGQPASQTPQFGAPASAQSLFGGHQSTPTSKDPSLFGTSGLFRASSHPAAFGTLPTSTQSPQFGQSLGFQPPSAAPSQAASPPNSLFGGQSPVIGMPQSSSSQPSMFGRVPAQASLFGVATTLSKEPAIPFGSQPPQFASQTSPQPAIFGAQSLFPAQLPNPQGSNLTAMSNPLFSQKK